MPRTTRPEPDRPARRVVGAATERDRGTLTTERVLRAAIRIADRDGAEALSMRNVARDLGFEVMSLYNHVRNKDAMLDGMLELVVSEIEPLAATSRSAWKPAVRTHVESARVVLAAHPWAIAEWPRRLPGPNRLAFMEGLLRGLDGAGIAPVLAYHGYHALLIHLLGFTLTEHRFTGMGAAAEAARFVELFPSDDYPLLSAHIDQHRDPDGPHDDFGFVLDLILDGIERARRAR